MTGIDTQGLINELLAYETDVRNPPDGRRVILDERVAVQATVQLFVARARTAQDVQNRARQAARVLAMWRNGKAPE